MDRGKKMIANLCFSAYQEAIGFEVLGKVPYRCVGLTSPESCYCNGVLN